jgi:uncharacterized protein YkwD
VAYRKARRLLGTGAVTACVLVPAAPAAGSTSTAIVRQVNTIRAERGLARLKITPQLNRAAAAHCAEMISGQVLSHGSLQSRLHRYFAAGSYGETIAWMPIGPASGVGAVVRAWMNSPPHRAVLLSRSFRRIGVGAERGVMGGQRGTSYTIDVAG